MELKIDNEFKNALPALSPEEYKNLETEILADGCLEPITVWDGYIIDGHNRYEICIKHSIPYQTKEKDFGDRLNVLMWILTHQQARRNLTDGQRANAVLRYEYLFQEQAKANQKQSKGRGQKGLGEIPKVNVREDMAKAAGVSPDTIRRVKTINEKGTPEQKKRIADGEKVGTVYKEVKGKSEQSEKETKQLNEWELWLSGWALFKNNPNNPNVCVLIKDGTSESIFSIDPNQYFEELFHGLRDVDDQTLYDYLTKELQKFKPKKESAIAS
jgi:hypothetical protein